MVRAIQNVASFGAEVISAPGPVAVYFWATWCAPCKHMAPALDEIAPTVKEKVSVCKVNVDDLGAIASQYGIRSVPTIIVFKGGQPKAARAGAGTKSALSQWLNEACA